MHRAVPIAIAAVLAAALPVGAAVAAPATTAAGAPRVDAMTIGKASVLSGPRTVSLAQRTVTVKGRRCVVGAGTPLAALIALRTLGGPTFTLGDRGHCGSTPKSSRNLFVTSVAGQKNTELAGWAYKIDRTKGTRAPADPAGAPLPSGSRVLWFWCARTKDGCQRTLEVQASAAAAIGTTLSVGVTGYDDKGRGAPAAGATVTLGSTTVQADPTGRIGIPVPAAAGTYQLGATLLGQAQAFPRAVVVQ